MKMPDHIQISFDWKHDEKRNMDQFFKLGEKIHATTGKHRNRWTYYKIVQLWVNSISLERIKGDE